ncbi:hypothetical protein CSV67_00185 [Sporosarcina sp. P2]|uniref:HEPN domain-containing protein n=1 Tax=Sporosarcina sp. P2 TaxID=2048251 RepID=UPI000C16A6B2|nr:HEPN domain-containing protein [Sporosarcina sp. P2]PID03937.1 hypothetical protein CSV67_00185 [Sporosarcina sp. P2]
MEFKKVFQLFNKLQSVVEKGGVKREDDEPFLRFEAGKSTLIIQGFDNVNVFNETVDYLWKSDQDIFDTFTRVTIKNILVDLLSSSIEGEEVTLDIIKKMIADLKEILEESFEVLYPVFGVNYFKAEPLEIGPYTIYNKNIHRSVLIKKYPYSESILSLELDDEYYGSDVVISVYENARELSRANEKACVKFRQFEDTIRFMIGDYSKRYDVGIYNFNSYRRTNSIILSKTNAGLNNSMSGTIDSINLHQFPIDDAEYGHDRIWRILAKTNPTNLEKRIITAIEWAGKAMRDEEPARAFTQYIFGLEALLQFQQKGVLVSPSITYQISEFAAFIITDELESRLVIEKTVKKLYSKRSAIAHGGSSDVDVKDVNEAMYLLKQIVMILLKDQDFKGFNSIEQIGEWVKIKKYS